MRIRKHARLLGLLPSISPCAHSNHLCELNISPWDVKPLPSQSQSNNFQGIVIDNTNSCEACNSVGGDDDFTRSVDPLKNTHLGEESKTNSIRCNKTNGNGWQCKREAENGKKLCKHHCPKQKSFAFKPARTAAKMVASKKKMLSSSPTDYYYYSGFGPSYSWKRKRTEENNVNGIEDSRNGDATIDQLVSSFSPTDYRYLSGFGPSYFYSWGRKRERGKGENKSNSYMLVEGSEDRSNWNSNSDDFDDVVNEV